MRAFLSWLLSCAEVDTEDNVEGCSPEDRPWTLTVSTMALFTPVNSKGMAQDLIGLARTVTTARGYFIPFHVEAQLIHVRSCCPPYVSVQQG